MRLPVARNTSEHHPFYASIPLRAGAEGTGWVNAEDLQIDNDIRNAYGHSGEVESIEIEQTSQALPRACQREIYNLTVDGVMMPSALRKDDCHFFNYYKGSIYVPKSLQ